MQSTQHVSRGVFRAGSASRSARGFASTSQNIISSQRRALRLPAIENSIFPRTYFFSTSSRINQQVEESKKVAEKKEAENQAGAEVLGSETNQPESNKDALKGEKSSSSTATEELEKTIKEKDARIKELSDAVLYGKADMQNMQRRSQEEKAQASDYAITKFARDLTSSLDVLGLALRSVPESLRTKPNNVSEAEDPRKAIAELYSGVELTNKSILDMLRMHGVTTFDPTGQKFNPQEHEAMYQAPVPGKEPGTVLECSKLGFKIKDRILRAAQVGVVQESA